MVKGKSDAKRRASSDRRGAQRLALKLPVVAHASDKQFVVTIRNLSSSGFLAEAEGLAAEPAATITCDFPNDIKAKAQVIWADDGLIGVKFADPLARSAFSAALLRAEKDAEKSVREGEALEHTRISGKPLENSASNSDKLPSNIRLVIYLVACLLTWTLVLAIAWYVLR